MCHPGRADVVPGLEVFGDLTLVDEIDCATDTTHRFRDYPAGRSYVTNILGVSTRAMTHVKKSETSGGKQSGSYISWRVGEGQGIIPNDPYVMVVDYPDEAPRSVTLVNFGIGSRHGYHTGFTVGESMSPVVAVPQSQESVNIPLSGEWKQLIEVMFPFERTVQYNGTGGSNKLTTATDGFDIDFVLLPWEQATDSLGVAVHAIRLYHINDYAAAKPTINYPVGNVPRRVITFREEMADDDGLGSYTTPTDFYVGKAKQMSLLGINTISRDLLEFGYMQYWQGDSIWGTSAVYWPQTIDAMTAEGHYILPYYEYAGSRGSAGLGYNNDYKPMTLSADTQSNKYLFSNQDYVYKCLVDLTLPQAYDDLKDLMDKTIFRYTDRGNFLGAWIRSRGQMPIGFGDKTIALFNQETGRTAAGTPVTRADIYNSGSYANTALYKEYRAWWYGKRRDLFESMRQYLVDRGLENPKFFYHGCIAEGGESWNDGLGNRVLAWRTTNDNKFQGMDWCEFTGKSVNRYEQWHSELYKQLALDTDFPTWNSAYEIGHSCPADDYYNYTNSVGVGLSYPFNCVYTVLEGAQVGNYRNASGDLFLARHYSLNEFCGKDQNLPDNEQAITGYFISDMDHAGRAVMISELRAMATWDPNMFGYLFGSEVDRLDATYVREFNLNFLSLPATQSEVLSGGGWGHDITVRRWTTAAGHYWAVINTGYNAFSGDLNFDTSVAKVYRTVGGEEVPISDGRAHVTMEPLQMIAFTDIAPAQPAVSVSEPVVTDTMAMLPVRVLTFGANGDSGTVTISYGTEPDYSGTTSTQLVVSATGVTEVSLSGLTPSTTYYALVTLANNAGETTTAQTSFTTATPSSWPAALLYGTAFKTNVTLTVTVSTLGVGATSCDLYAVARPENPSFSSVASSLGAVNATGDYTFSLGPLSSETTYTVTLFGTNNLACGGLLATRPITTQKSTESECEVLADEISEDGTALCVPVSYVNDNEDNFLVVFVSVGNTAPAIGDSAQWDVGVGVGEDGEAGSVGPHRAMVTFDSLALTEGAKVWVSAWFFNPRTGFNDWTEPVGYTAEGPRIAVKLGPAVATVADNGESALLSVEVTSLLAESASLFLSLDGIGIGSFVVTGTGTFSTNVTVAATGNHSFVFTATAEDDTAVAAGSFRVVSYTGWFHVDLADAGYAAFPDVTGVAAPGGTWMVAADVNAVYDNGVLSIGDHETTGVALRYTPTTPSVAGSDVKIEGRIQVIAQETLITDPTALAGIAFTLDRERPVVRVLANGAWHAHPATVAQGAWVDWMAEFDFSSAEAPQVRYTVAGLSGEWLSLGGGTQISAVGYQGIGSIGSFRGLYAITEEPIEIIAPALVVDGTALEFPTSVTFSVTIGNAIPGIWYTAFTSETLDGEYLAEVSVQATVADGGILALPIDATPPSKFVKLVASDHVFEKYDPLPTP